ncbi:MAG: three-Cys-motif partner protein TcmP [Dethiosulfatibacter sp.]|nr:three-Cys-motif partner protein TcmP [Dethiosulfatibacter sp.]
MNCAYLINELKIDEKVLDGKKQQTNYKIKYVIEYIRLWLIINSRRKEVENINFIDCMCNAGIFKDGDLGTSVEVFLLFIDNAKSYPDKMYNLFLNDYDSKRVKTIKLLLNYFSKTEQVKNINCFISNKDVNEYLQEYGEFDKYLKYNAATVLFVDPYDFGTVKIDNVQRFINRYYCELIFNFFSSDYVRNGLDVRIRECIGNIDVKNKDDLIKYICECFRIGRIRHVFSYKFKTLTNTEIYQIIFATPSDKGLDKLKESLWKVFNGKFNHRNYKTDGGQLSLFTEEDDRKCLLSMHSLEAKKMLLEKYENTTVSYNDIEKFLTEKTMMMTTQFLNHVIKPLINEGYIKKCGLVTHKNNFKKDSYTFCEGVNN